MSRALRNWRGTGIRPLDDLYQEMDQLFQNFVGEGSSNGSSEFKPRLNVVETETGYEVTLDLPGVKPENVNVEVHENALTVSGSRKVEEESEGRTFHRVERQYGEFRRVVSLPAPIDEEKITAEYDHGVLTVSIPKSEKLKPTRIPIKASAS